MTSITYTATLDVGRETAETLAQLLREHRERLGTRRRTRALGVFKQSVLMLRWFVDGTRLVQLARDSGVSVPTAYRYLHEGLTVLADHAPDLSTALERAATVGYTHLNPSQRVLARYRADDHGEGVQGQRPDRPGQGAAETLAEPKWTKKLSAEDRRGLTALFWSNINPYGTFRLDMNKRLDLAPAATVPRPRAPADTVGKALAEPR